MYLSLYNCSFIIFDMAGLLTSYGYTVTEAFDESADVYLINSCTVKNPSEDTFVNLVHKAQSMHKPVVVAGEYPSY